MACQCGWDIVELPNNQSEALKLTHQAEGLLEVVQRDSSRWLTLLRCTVCGNAWAEEGMDSGQMTAFFYYPVRDPDPETWFATVKRLDPPPDPDAWGFPK